ncbi:PAAR domain-containing protein [Stenotrophomonas maltophilia]|uniref:PAAR domain-containing protein n=1 Tax=Stenotrophomonas maltophilia TaxID=40324 RepID=UPI0007F0012C|nr:PAAR domain-containing protein [Stenotrophomonas maltophilia]OBU48964.1 hypothetical protein A9K76_12740 [Stenotrophomonas maltophilia]
MGRLIVVVGDATSGGGRVITGSAFTDINGHAVARVSDRATCPKHQGIFPIVTGDDSWIVDGQPVARDGDRLACGCSLLAGAQQTTHIAAAGALAPATSEGDATAHAPAPDEFTVHSTQKEPVCRECLLAAARSGAAYLRR